MKNSIPVIIALAALTLLSACSSNENLVSLKEYDDLYYQGDERAFVPLSASTTTTKANSIPGATAAEQSYYSNAPYDTSTPTPAEASVDPNEDYYDADYGRRLQNFHNPGGDQAYMYGDPNGFNNGGNWNSNVGMGMGMGMGRGGFGPQSFWGGSVGFGNGFNNNPWGSPFYDPFYSPFNNPYNSAFHPYGGFNNCFGNGFNNGFNNGFGNGFNNGFGNGFGNGFNNGFGHGGFNPYLGYNPFCPWGFNNPYFGNNPFNGSGDNGNFNSGVTNTPRSNSTRPPRGGVVGGGNTSGISTQPNSDRTRMEDGVIRDAKSAETRDTRSDFRPGATAPAERTREVTPTSREVITPRGTMPTRTSSEYGRNTTRGAPESPQTISPYARERSTQRESRSINGGSVAPTRSGSGTRYTQPDRSRSTFDTPARSSPSFSSPSRSGGGSGGGSSPSSPSPSRRR